MAILQWEPPERGHRAGGVERNLSCEPISGSIEYCEWFTHPPSAIHAAVTDHGKLMTLVAGKQRILLMVGDNGEMFTTRSLNITLKTTEQHLIVHSAGKTTGTSEAYCK